MDASIMVSILGTLVQAVATVVSIAIAIFVLILGQQGQNLKKISDNEYKLHKVALGLTLGAGFYIIFIFLSPTFEFHIALLFLLIFILILIKLFFLKKDTYKKYFRHYLILAVTIATLNLTLIGSKILFEAISIMGKPSLTDIEFWDVIKDGRIFFAVFLSYTFILILFILANKTLESSEHLPKSKSS